MDLFQKCDFELLKKSIALDVYPYFHVLESKQAPVVQMEGRKIIMLGSNNYLGLTENEHVIRAGKEALDKYGSGVSGSRFLNGTLDIHVQLEHELADFLGYEACLTCSTGFQTNLAIISAIVGRDDYILCDKENHASIYDACRLSYGKTLRYKHSDMEDLNRQLKNIPPTAGKLIVSDGVFSMRGDICKLPDIVELAKKYNARIMIDDAHGFGVIGPNGKGTNAFYNLSHEVDILMLTFSKSLASVGGCVLATKRVIDYIKHVSRPFIFSASMPPSNVATTIEALHQLQQNPHKTTDLLTIASYTRQQLKQNNIPIIESPTPIVPIYTYKTLETLWFGKKLFEEGVYVNPIIAPACVEGECLLRLSLMASHTKDIIDQAVAKIVQVLQLQPHIQNQ